MLNRSSILVLVISLFYTLSAGAQKLKEDLKYNPKGTQVFFANAQGKFDKLAIRDFAKEYLEQIPEETKNALYARTAIKEPSGFDELVALVISDFQFDGKQLDSEIQETCNNAKIQKIKRYMEEELEIPDAFGNIVYFDPQSTDSADLEVAYKGKVNLCSFFSTNKEALKGKFSEDPACDSLAEPNVVERCKEFNYFYFEMSFNNEEGDDILRLVKHSDDPNNPFPNTLDLDSIVKADINEMIEKNGWRWKLHADAAAMTFDKIALNGFELPLSDVFVGPREESCFDMFFLEDPRDGDNKPLKLPEIFGSCLGRCDGLIIATK